MKKLSNYFVFIVLFLAGGQLFGQGQYQVTPANATQQAQQIYLDYSSVVTTPFSNLESYIIDLSQPFTYHPDAINGSLVVAGMDLDNIDVNWSVQSGATSYGISYFHLGTGVNNLTTASGTTDDASLPNMPDGWYILAITTFQVIGGQTVSSFGDIIIVEKKVFIHLGDSGEQCDCEAEEIIFNASGTTGANGVIGLNQVEFAWSPEAFTDYVIKVEYVDESSTAYLNLGPELNYGGYPQWLVNINCFGNIWDTEIPNTLYGYSQSDPLVMSLSPGNYYWNLEHNENIMKSVTFKPCIAKQGGGHGGEKRKIRVTDAKIPIISPNPTREYLTVFLEGKSPESSITVEIYDQAGKNIANHSTTLESSQIDVSNFAAGSYFVKIKSEQTNHVERFIKID